MPKVNSLRRTSSGWSLSCNPVFEPKKIQPVRVRSGIQVVTGKMIGGHQQPRAFVWVEEAANDPSRALVICPDLQGNWLWEQGLETSLRQAFPKRTDLLPLARAFNHWCKLLEKHWSADRDQPRFWSSTHESGVKMARQLQALLIDEASVHYWRPAQDPRSHEAREIIL